MQDSGQALHLVPSNKGDEPIISDEANVPVDDELSSGNSPTLGFSPAKNTRAKLRRKTSYRPAFNNVVSGASCRERREVCRGLN